MFYAFFGGFYPGEGFFYCIKISRNIDPPYNTGNDFVYNDDFAEDAETYLANSGQFDVEGNRLMQNTESNGRFHTDWLNMIFPRLKLARDLLTEDGAIFISIGDDEEANLIKLCDEVFGEKNSYRGNNLYHICEFAELYQNHGCHGIIPLRKSLPESCFSTLGATGELIVITKGEKGYSPTDVFPQNASPKEGAAALNAANGVTKAQEAAMVAGSMFGWETPAANPKNYDSLGQPIKNQRRSHAAER